MRLRFFLLGMLVGLLLAPASGRELWLRARDLLAAGIDVVLRLAAQRGRSMGINDAL